MIHMSNSDQVSHKVFKKPSLLKPSIIKTSCCYDEPSHQIYLGPGAWIWTQLHSELDVGSISEQFVQRAVMFVPQQ